jgi:hypothetical protein
MFVPSVNISPATEHGEVVILMPANSSFFATQDLVAQLRQGLRNYNFEKGDSVVALGDPVVIAVVGALLAERNKAFYILRWDRQISRYVKVKIAL